MALSTDLISQFVKNTKDETTTKPETTTYGTVRVTEEGEPEVQLDGSATYIPIKTTVEVKDGDRVVVMIKNHTATITGNLTSPAAKVETVTIVEEQVSTKVSADVLEATFANVESMIAGKADVKLLNSEISNVKNLIANKASVEQLTAESIRVNELISGAEARITSLEAADVTISGRVEANEAAISSLQTDKLDAANAKITYATIENLNSATADIDTLKTTKLDSDAAKITYATIADLDSAKAEFGTLDSDVGDIRTLIFGSATGDTIQTSFANAVIAQLGDAQIKSAMIENVSADKITSGDIITNNVRVRSEDGSLVISDETLQISDGTRVRVQIGKDAAEDYSINIWDQNGNLMFSKGGITDAAIKEAIIRNDMVSDTANIHASKLDIDSLFEEINGSSNTIKSTQILLDDESQTLDVAFKELTTEVTDQGESITSQGTSISTIQGQIASKIWQEDISTAVDELEIGGRNYFIRKNINNLAWGSGNTIVENPAYRGYSFPVTEGEEWILYRTDTTNNRWGLYWLTSEPSTESTDITFAMRSDEQVANYINHFIVPTGITWGFIYLSNASSEIPNIMLEKGNKATDWTPAPEDIDGDMTALSTKYSSLEQNLESFKTTVGETYSTKTELSNSTAALNSSIEQNTTSIESLVTRTEVVENKFNNYSTTEEMTSAISQKADSITSSVSSIYATKSEVKDLDIGGRNYFRPNNTVDLGCTGLASGEQSLISTGACVGFYIPTTAGDVWSMSRADLSNNRFDYCFCIDEPTSGCLIYQWNSGARELLKIEGIAVPEGYNYLFVYLSNQNDDLPNIKIERGEYATDWTPAPEDMATYEEVENAQSTADDASTVASNAETLVKQLSDSISMLVTDGNGTSLMTQTEDGWTFSTADIQDHVNTLSETLNSLQSEVGDTSHTIDILQQAVDDLGTISEYVKIRTYEDEPCIELGESDSEFKLRITNTRMIFTEGSTELAYFNNQSLHIIKAVVEDELQQGNFVWKIRSNGNLGLTWKGGN